MKLSKEQLQGIVTTFQKSVQHRKPVIFCVQCGSTSIDQNSIDELRCYNCGNTLTWNAYRFSVYQYESDITLSLKTVMRDEFSNWHNEMEKTVGSFTKKIIIDAVYSTRDLTEKIEDIENQWNECKERVEKLIKERKEEHSR
jgi:hypothetical protein